MFGEFLVSYNHDLHVDEVEHRIIKYQAGVHFYRSASIASIFSNMKKYFLPFAIILAKLSFAQTDSVVHPLTFSGMADAYAAYYSDSVGIDSYQKFPSVSPRSKQIGLNVASITAKYSADRVRAIVTLQYGDIPRSSWSATFNFIQEANAGFRLCKNLWIDGGFFRTHIGTEGLFPKENITSSVAVATFFEPYYEAGFRLNYTPSDKVVLNLFVLNGYNLYEDNNKKKSAGIFATYSINNQWSIGYNNYLGDDTPDEDTVSHFRFYNNFFVNFEKGRIKIVAGADAAVQQHSDIVDQNHSAKLLSGVLSIKVKTANHFSVYGRGELYHDPQGILSGAFPDDNGNLTGLKLWGATLGLEYKPSYNSYLRLEGRDLTAGNNIFNSAEGLTKSRYEALLNLGVWFP